MIFVLLLFTLVSCATPTTKGPRISVSEVSKEIVAQAQEEYDKNMDKSLRLQQIEYRIMQANRAFCGKKVRNRLGFSYMDKTQAQNIAQIYQELFKNYTGLKEFSTFPTVTEIIPHSQAKEAGLQVGDVILAIDGQKVQVHKKAGKYKSNFPKLLKNRKYRRGLTGFYFTAESIDSLTVKRRIEYSFQDTTLTLHLDGSTLACDYPVVIVDKRSKNAFTDGKKIFVTAGLVDFSTDDELANVIGHELAHCTEDHIGKKKANELLGSMAGAVIDGALGTYGTAQDFGNTAYHLFSPEFELEADYVGLYFTHRAGFNTSETANFWRKMAELAPLEANSLGHTHPPTATRYLYLAKTHEEILLKKLMKDPLVPNRAEPAQ